MPQSIAKCQKISPVLDKSALQIYIRIKKFDFLQVSVMARDLLKTSVDHQSQLSDDSRLLVTAHLLQQFQVLHTVISMTQTLAFCKHTNNSTSAFSMIASVLFWQEVDANHDIHFGISRLEFVYIRLSLMRELLFLVDSSLRALSQSYTKKGSWNNWNNCAMFSPASQAW